MKKLAVWVNLMSTIPQSITAMFTRKLAIITVIVLSIGILGCTASLPPSSQRVIMSGQSSGFFKKAVRSLTAGGYEIKSADPSIGIIQAFRPLKGPFSQPGYGHNVTITIDKDSFTVKAFPIAGVVGGETPEEIKDEVIKLIKK